MRALPTCPRCAVEVSSAWRLRGIVASSLGGALAGAAIWCWKTGICSLRESCSVDPRSGRCYGFPPEMENHPCMTAMPGEDAARCAAQVSAQMEGYCRAPNERLAVLAALAAAVCLVLAVRWLLAWRRARRGLQDRPRELSAVYRDEPECARHGRRGAT